MQEGWLLQVCPDQGALQVPWGRPPVQGRRLHEERAPESAVSLPWRWQTMRLPGVPEVGAALWVLLCTHQAWQELGNYCCLSKRLALSDRTSPTAAFAAPKSQLSSACFVTDAAVSPPPAIAAPVKRAALEVSNYPSATSVVARRRVRAPTTWPQGASCGLSRRRTQPPRPIHRTNTTLPASSQM